MTLPAPTGMLPRGISGRLRSLVRWRLSQLTGEQFLLLLMLPVVAFLALAKLESYPVITGWDEGIYLQFASNLALHGEYATRDGAEFHRLMPVPATGPTVIVPVALALGVSACSLLAARLVMALYLAIALLGAYLLLRRIGGVPTALAGVILFLAAGHGEFDTLWMGRQVLGEVPGFAFMLLGLWVWTMSWRGGWKPLIAGSLLLALAVVTKNQLIWVIWPALFLIGLVDRLYYRQLDWSHTILPLAAVSGGYGCWLLLSIWVVGPAGVEGYLDSLRSATIAAVLHFNPQVWLMNLKLALKSQQGVMALVALPYCLYTSRGRSVEGLSRALLPVLATFALLTFIAISLPWPRLFYPASTLIALCVAVLVGDLAGRAAGYLRIGQRWVPALSCLAALILAGPRLAQDSASIATFDDPSPAKFAALVDQQVPVGSDVLGWEWELEFYSDHSFRHPPHRLFPALVDQVYSQRGDPILDEPRFPAGVEYLVVGPFATQVQVFTSALAETPHQLLVSEGPYSLYKLDR